MSKDTLINKTALSKGVIHIAIGEVISSLGETRFRSPVLRTIAGCCGIEIHFKKLKDGEKIVVINGRGDMQGIKK